MTINKTINKIGYVIIMTTSEIIIPAQVILSRDRYG